MNELIEELWVEHNTGMYTGFKQAIQKACKAQRNACAREFRHNRRNIGLSVAEKSIKNAEIRKEDYE